MASTGTGRGRARAALDVAVRTHPAQRHVDIALFAVRVALAWIFVYYGGAKLFGWFGGGGVHGTAQFFSDTAHLHPGTFFAVLGGVIELGGAIALVVGVGVRLVGVALVGDMVMAVITVTGRNGINSEKVNPGYELNLALAALALAVVLLGAGRFSLDALLERRISADATGR
jgi:putative oxidoreductase